MLNAMSSLLSSLARRLVPLRRRKGIATSPSFVASRRPFFPIPCGGCGHCDVVSDGAFVVLRKTTPRKLKLRLRHGRVGEPKRKKRGSDGDGEEPCVWRRAILLGRRCQPLEFAGAIHYDCEGQRLWQPRTPPPSSPLLRPARYSELGYMDRA